MRKLTIPKLFIWLRRKGVFRDFFNLDFLISSFREETCLTMTKKGAMLMPPVEVMIGSNEKQRQEEYAELITLSQNGSVQYFIHKKCRGERNQVFRWNSFYPLFDLYLRDKESQYSKFICTYLTIWVSEFIVSKKRNEFCWYDMADSFRLLLLIDVLSNKDYQNIMSKNQKDILSFGVKRHYRMVSSRHFASLGNHRIFQLIASIKYNEYIKNKKNREYFTDELLKFRGQQFGADNIHLEHSPEYHIWASILFSKMFNEYVAIYTQKQQIKESLDFSRFLFCCNGLIPLIGDSGHEHSRVYADLVAVNERANEFFLLKESGYIVKGNDTKGFYFISSYKTHSGIHRHNDSGSYELSLGGVKVVSDSGKYSYTPCEESLSVRKSESHNVFLIEDLHLHDQISYQVDMILEDGDCKVVCLTGNLEYECHTRVFLIFDCALIVVDFCSSSKSKLSSYINFSPNTSSSGYFTPLLGVKDTSSENSHVSDKYLKLKDNTRLKLIVDSISAYSISSSKVKSFELNDKEVSFMYKNNNYKFNLRECRNV